MVCFVGTQPGKKLVCISEETVSIGTTAVRPFKNVPDGTVLVSFTLLSGNINVTFDGKTTPVSTTTGHKYAANTASPYSFLLSAEEARKVQAIGDGSLSSYVTYWK